MRLLFFTDTHIRAFVNARRDDFFTSILSKMKEIGQIAEKHQVNYIIHGGDFFDIPVVSERLKGMVAAILRSYPVPVYVVPGNHDIIGQNIKTLNQTSLGVLVKSGVVIPLTRTSPALLRGKDLTISLQGQEYYKDMDKDIADYQVEPVSADFKILVTHGMLLPAPFHPDVPSTVFNDVPNGADLILTGHYHPGWASPPRRPGRPIMINPGSLARMNSMSSNYTRPIQVVLIDISPLGIAYKYIPLQSVLPAEKVLIKQENKESIPLAAFSNTLSNQIQELAASPRVDVFEMFRKLEIDKNLYDMCDNFLNQASEVTGFSRSSFEWPYQQNILNSIHIKGFQSHVDTTLNFHSGLNVIVGPSDNGKSASLRALWWLLYNEPSGTEFFNDGTKTQSVEADFMSARIKRSRTKTNAGTYTITKPGEEEVVLKGFGKKVPLKVIEAHQMPQVMVLDSNESVNIARQRDPDFLMGVTPSVRVGLLNVLAGVNVADEASKLALQETNKLGSELNYTVKTIEELTERLNSLPNYKDVDEICAKAVKCFEGAEFSQQKKAEAEQWLEKYILETNELSQLESRIEYISANLDQMVESVSAWVQNEQQIKDARAVYDSYSRLVADINRLNANIEGLRIKNRKALDEFKILLERIGVCPSCYRVFDEETISAIVHSVNEDKSTTPLNG
jgi:exonuclease SbcC